ncbi:MAG: hypothetical protein AAGA30_14640, partial [Planctomycetota bacterium]
SGTAEWPRPIDDAIGLLDLPKFGVVEAPEVGTAVAANHYPSIQHAIDDVTNPASSSYGRMVWIPAATYGGAGSQLRRIFLKTGVHLKIHSFALFHRDHEAPNVNGGFYSSMWHGAFIKNSDFFSPISDVIVEGGLFFNDAVNNGSDNMFTGGSVIANLCDRFVCRNVNIGNHGVPDGSQPQGGESASVIYLVGHDIFVYNNEITNPEGFAGKDGVHLWGGGRLHVMSNFIEAGDDAIATASSPISNLIGGRTQTIQNLNIEDVEIFNNVLISHNARVLHAGHANSVVPAGSMTPYPRMTNTVENIRFRNFFGICGGVNQMLNVSSVTAPSKVELWPFSGQITPAQVRNVVIKDGHIKGSDTLSLTMRRPPNGIRIRTDDIGSVYNVLIDNVRVRNVEPEFDMFGNLDQSSRIFVVEKVLMYRASPLDWLFYGHDNEMIQVQNCIFDAKSLDDFNQPDGGPDAMFLYWIDGLVPFEINDIENSGNNTLNFFSLPQDPGTRRLNQSNHTGNSNN